MKIDHIFHNLNPFGGAEEHITSLAEIQKAQGEDVQVCLIQAVTAENQYAQRLAAAGVPICQWPVWLSRLSGDWDTRESILRHLLMWQAPLIALLTIVVARARRQPRQRARESVEGRLRRVLGSFLNPAREKRLFLLMMTWRYYRRRPDVLHLHSYGAGLEYVLRWARARNMAVVYQEHSTPDLTTRRWKGMPTGLNFASVVVAVSKTSAQALSQLCGVTRPIEVVPPILNLSMPGTRWDHKPMVRHGMVQILTIARLSEEKGLSCLIEAAERVVAAGREVRFAVYGEGYLRQALQAQIDAAKLREHVRLAGPFARHELPGIMGGADIFVLPSLTEGLPLSVVEAMAWGVPVVTTAVGGVPELVENGVTGLLCQPRDVEGLAQAILVLVDDPARRRALGRAAQNMYQLSRFKPERAATQLSQVYSNALQIQRCARASFEHGSAA